MKKCSSLFIHWFIIIHLLNVPVVKTLVIQNLTVWKLVDGMNVCVILDNSAPKAVYASALIEAFLDKAHNFVKVLIWV